MQDKICKNCYWFWERSAEKVDCGLNWKDLMTIDPMGTCDRYQFKTNLLLPFEMITEETL
jgi:hypothetical protein